MEDNILKDVLKEYEGTPVEKGARLHYYEANPLGDYDNLPDLAKFMWLAFAERVLKNVG